MVEKLARSTDPGIDQGLIQKLLAVQLSSHLDDLDPVETILNGIPAKADVAIGTYMSTRVPRVPVFGTCVCERRGSDVVWI